MRRSLVLFLLLPLFASGQTAKPLSQAELTDIYTQAITDFIKAAVNKNKTVFDTLFFGKRKNGQPDDFPDITLPRNIQNTEIRLIAPETGERLQRQRKARVYINLVGWADRKGAEFLFFVFSNGFAHQYNYTLQYEYNEGNKAFELTTLRFKGPPFDK